MPTSAHNRKLLHPINDFIAEQLPAWLKQASPADIQQLQACADRHLASQKQLAEASRQLLPLDGFAKGLLEHLIESRLGQAVDLDKAVWREERLRVTPPLIQVLPGQTLPDIQPVLVYEPALQRLLRNFTQGQSFNAQTALLQAAPAADGTVRVAGVENDRLVAICREADVGAAYQTYLAEHLNADFQARLATDKRLELALAVEIAALKGQLGRDDLNMLRAAGRGQRLTHATTPHVRFSGLEVLAVRVEGALLFELLEPPRSQAGYLFGAPVRTASVIAYLPDDQGCPLRRFASWDALNRHLVQAMRSADYRRAFARRVALADLASYQNLLSQRLSDSQPDLAPRWHAVGDAVFTDLAARHVQRIKDDARLLAVPTAQVDADAHARRLRQLEEVGLTLLNLAGLFVPAIGALLLADMARQVVGEVCEGVHDWSLGHQHEAMQHMLQVAASVASVATVGAVTWGLHTASNAFVEALEPVVTEAGGKRLWHNDLTPYQDTATPSALAERDDGLFSDGRGVWWYRDQAFYKVRQDAEGGWRLQHRDGSRAYGPRLRGNGERAWRLEYERPLEWAGESLLLTRLWPAARLLDAARVTQILQVAGVDENTLRGLLVRHLRLPVGLRDTLERFAVEARNEEFLAHPGDAQRDARWAWCIERLGLQATPLAQQGGAISAAADRLREPMLEHFAELYLRQDAALPVLQRAFPGLPKAYALEVLDHASAVMRQRMLDDNRLPLALARRARVMLLEARLTRARESLFLRGSYHPDGVALAFALLREHGLPTRQTNLVLRQQATTGGDLARLFAGGAKDEPLTVLVRNASRFELYDNRGRSVTTTVAEPKGLFEVLSACLASDYRQQQGWTGDSAPVRMRAQMQAWLPGERQAVLALLGWREARAEGAVIQRLADGRVGYPLGGAISVLDRPGRMLRRRIRSLYPSFDEEAVERFVRILSQSNESPLSQLLEQEQQYARLEARLRRWTEAVDMPQQVHRRQVSGAFLGAWRLEGERVANLNGQGWGARLSILSVHSGGLPDLPANTDFTHVYELALVDMRFSELPVGFLDNFPNLQHLDLSYNGLTELPAGIEHLTRLRALILRGNRIRIRDSLARFPSSLTLLRILDLTGNSVRASSLHLGQLTHLRELGLRRTGLTAVPSGLERCVGLVYADLRNNQISQIPQALQEAPLRLREAVDLRGNALSAEVPHTQEHGGDRAGVLRVREQWLATLAAGERHNRQGQWDRLSELPRSAGFFGLLEEMTRTADFRLFTSYTSERAWALVDAASRDDRVREELFDLASDPRTCVDSIAHSFSQLVVRMHVVQALQGGTPLATRSARLLLAQRLFRLDEVTQLARADIEARYADGRWQRGQREEEEIEVSMAYLSGLSTRLNLLGQPRAMQFWELAEVTQRDVDDAYTAVLAAEASEARLVYISQRDFWLEYLEARNEQAFTTVRDQYEAQMHALEDEQQTLSSGAYLQRYEQLAKAREAALQALALRLTRKEMNRID